MPAQQHPSRKKHHGANPAALAPSRNGAKPQVSGLGRLASGTSVQPQTAVLHEHSWLKAPDRNQLQEDKRFPRLTKALQIQTGLSNSSSNSPMSKET